MFLLDKINDVYRQQFGSEPSKYLKYMIITFAGCGLYILRNIFWRIYHNIRKYPNGPMGLPFFGCLFQFGIAPRKFLVNIANKYGPITYVPLMMSNNIFISDSKILNKIYKDECFRPSFNIRETPAIVEINPPKWKLRRKYAKTTVITLANTTFVLSNVKQCIEHYIEPIMDETYIKNNKLWYPADYIHYIAFNNIWSVVFDDILPFNDIFMEKYCKLSDQVERATGISILTNLMTNYAIKLPKFIQRRMIWKYTKNADNMLMRWMNKNGFEVDSQRNILERTKKYSENDKKCKVYVDFLIERFQNKEMTLFEILSDLQTILMAAIETTSMSSEYGFLLLAKNENIQEMIYNELISVMNKHNLKEFEFKILNALHLFRAFIYEVLRISCVAPMGIPHLAMKDHKIVINKKEIIIPKYSILHSNTYYVHKYLDWNNNNKSLKEENNDIHLEYWLDPMSKTFKKNENFILFGAGARDCVGQQLAMKVLFAIYGLFMIKYKFVAPNNDPESMNIKQLWSGVLTIDPKIGIKIQRR